MLPLGGHVTLLVVTTWQQFQEDRGNVVQNVYVVNWPITLYDHRKLAVQLEEIHVCEGIESYVRDVKLSEGYRYISNISL